MPAGPGGWLTGLGMERCCGRQSYGRSWLFRAADEGENGGAELVVLVDAGLDGAAVDDTAVLGG